MSFKITARTILQLGAELISSDAVALYELIKNAIDARSSNGVDIKFSIVMLLSKYEECLAYIGEGNDIDACRSFIYENLQADAEREDLDSFRSLIRAARNCDELRDALVHAYRAINRIVVTDTGHGMSKSDLEDIYLTIGTSSRAKDVNAQLKDGGKGESIYLGEKGVGRLSVMRLGRRLSVQTAKVDEKNYNILDIDWREFEAAYDKSHDSVVITVKQGEAKPLGQSGTKIIISDLTSVWTTSVLEENIRGQIARLTDPFVVGKKRRFPIRFEYNGSDISYAAKIEQLLLDNAHAICKATYKIIDGKAQLKVDIVENIYNGSAYSDTHDELDLKVMVGLEKLGYPLSTLRKVGDFEFQLYWYNRQKIKGIPDLGNRAEILKLIEQWVGVMLFRDGYRVLPYGDEGDDWLGLNRKALSASGYKLNTKQFIGRVAIGRINNPYLLDQTNRQGLQDCPEKTLLVNCLQSVIVNRMAFVLEEGKSSEKTERLAGFDVGRTDKAVKDLEKRASQAVRKISQHYSGPEHVLQQVKDSFAELKDAYSRAVDKLGVVENERERMTHLAGIGLTVELVAHELARVTEFTQKTLRDVPEKEISQELKGVFDVLESQLKSIQKRLAILEPLSVSARQRRAMKDVGDIINFVLTAHDSQFKRHNVRLSLDLGRSPVKAFVIEGLVVQILENLISNSVYWLKAYSEEHESFQPEINIVLTGSPPMITYQDNGPGIPISRREVVFQPFFSTKGTIERHGLGLYIARDCAEMMGGTLTLCDEPVVQEGRLNTFVLELAEEAK
ncbi:RstB [Pseudomonas stutzeri]|uniref:histidine kinase n=1 Tax=Stutzerimonas stutzeri NF13 TaxID=1212548 RepID=M2TKL8_STUST|nr:sensor histidine kinase [Stutzerimonas stutzeri]EMD98010.1 RstB [Stutzerimonas stutzeri NF13]MBK3880818.1 RstB [Stutzerimonas stutzeri]